MHTGKTRSVCMDDLHQDLARGVYEKPLSGYGVSKKHLLEGPASDSLGQSEGSSQLKLKQSSFKKTLHISSPKSPKILGRFNSTYFDYSAELAACQAELAANGKAVLPVPGSDRISWHSCSQSWGSTPKTVFA